MTDPKVRPSRSFDVVAVEKARDLSPLPSVAGSPKTLPNEVLLIIFNPLKKNELKVVRCVCRLFARLASPLLFDRIYISPHRQNLDVYCKIAQHQDLCHYPRTLIYDVQEFKENMDPEDYYQKLCHQLFCFLNGGSRAAIEHVDKELEGLLRMTKASSNPAKKSPNLYEKFSSCRIVQRGLELYAEKAEEQDHYNSGELLACLCIGLTRLTRVEEVKFQSRWHDWHLQSVDWSKNPRDLRLSSSPLARAWSPFHLKPSSTMCDTPITLEFDNVVSAFSLTGRPLKVLDASSPQKLAYEIFHSKSYLSRTFRQHSFPAMYFLESLTLQLNLCHYSQSGAKFEDPKEKTLPVDLLTVAVHSMPNLKSLTLDGSVCDTGNGLISIRELFHTFAMPALEDLDLSGMLGSAGHISAFLRAQRRLRRLSLRAIELSEGTWADLVDEMRRWLVSLLSLDLELPLREDGGVDLWDDDSWMVLDISNKIEEYVLEVDGVENPLRAPR